MNLEKKIALVCASNQNRSVEAHALFLSKGIKNVYSFGTSGKCKLPGPSIDKPNIYPFGTPYKKIYEDLKSQNSELYKANGLLTMLERNSKVKDHPERWQETKIRFDFVITFEERVFDTVVEDILNRSSVISYPVYIFNLQTKDNHEEAAIAANHAFQLIQMINEDENWDDHLDDILEQFQQKTGREIYHNILFY
jgi:RNA polymerase II subunit A C-terminal domain phosphatase SSU72